MTLPSSFPPPHTHTPTRTHYNTHIHSQLPLTCTHNTTHMHTPASHTYLIPTPNTHMCTHITHITHTHNTHTSHTHTSHTHTTHTHTSHTHNTHTHAPHTHTHHTHTQHTHALMHHTHTQHNHIHSNRETWSVCSMQNRRSSSLVTSMVTACECSCEHQDAPRRLTPLAPRQCGRLRYIQVSYGRQLVHSSGVRLHILAGHSFTSPLSVFTFHTCSYVMTSIFDMLYYIGAADHGWDYTQMCSTKSIIMMTSSLLQR